MQDASGLDAARTNALNRIDRMERRHRLAVAAGAVVELLFLAGYLLLADFSNRLHVLLLLATVATYTVVALGLAALAAQASRNTSRLIEAMRLLQQKP